MRFYDAKSGKILIIGQNISRVMQDSLHRLVWDNICYGRQNASEDVIMDAAKQAAAHDFIAVSQDLYGKF